MDTGIYIGAQTEAVKEARLAIMDILEAACGDTTKVAALEALNQLCGVNNSSISNCNIDGSTHNKYDYPDAWDEKEE
ncbi:MAG: hypothetical protein M3R04_01360 [bacterium]|nr:hypothetical protein [bacterium]